LKRIVALPGAISIHEAPEHRLGLRIEPIRELPIRGALGGALGFLRRTDGAEIAVRRVVRVTGGIGEPRGRSPIGLSNLTDFMNLGDRRGSATPAPHPQCDPRHCDRKHDHPPAESMKH